MLRFARVPFGTISSPFLLAAAVKCHLNRADTPVAKKISDNMYVDNMITGVATTKQADEFYKEAKPLFQSSLMNLRERASNSKEFIQSIPESDRAVTQSSSMGLTIHHVKSLPRENHYSQSAEFMIHWLSSRLPH